MDKWNQEKLPEVKDAQNIASDLFKIGACILGRQQKWLQCIIQMCSWLVTVEPQLQTVSDCQCFNGGESLLQLFGEVIGICQAGQNLLV